MLHDKLLAGRVALVTGGSRGLGREICRALAREGAAVAFTYRRSEDEAAVTSAILEELGGRHAALQADVRDRERMLEVAKAVEAELGTTDILVNNAGISQVVPLALIEEADWDAMMDTTVKGAFLATQAVLRGMVREKRGHILNIGSLAGGAKMMNAPVHYSAAKAALRGFTEALAKEVGRYGIVVNCVAPGVLEGGASRNLPERRLAQYLDHCALGRVGTLEEVAEVVAFLVSSRNTYMTGATIVLDGAV